MAVLLQQSKQSELAAAPKQRPEKATTGKQWVHGGFLSIDK